MGSEVKYNILDIKIVPAIITSVCSWPEWLEVHIRRQGVILGHVVQ